MDERLSFEEALNRLDRIVKTLEAGGLTLEQAVALFGEGMGLAQICSERLNAAELKITQLQTPFEQELESEGEAVDKG